MNDNMLQRAILQHVDIFILNRSLQETRQSSSLACDDVLICSNTSVTNLLTNQGSSRSAPRFCDVKLLLSKQSGGLDESSDGNNSLRSPSVNPIQQSRSPIPSHLCHILQGDDKQAIHRSSILMSCDVTSFSYNMIDLQHESSEELSWKIKFPPWNICFLCASTHDKTINWNKNTDVQKKKKPLICPGL